MQTSKTGQDIVVDDCWPCIVLCRQSSVAANGMQLRWMSLQILVETHKFPWVCRLQHQRVPTRYRIILSGPPGACDSPHRHGLQPNEAKRLMPTVGKHSVGPPKEHTTGFGVQLEA